MFIDISCTRGELKDTIAKITKGEKDSFRTIETEFGEIDVNENEYFYSKDKDGSFIYYKFFLDIEPNETTIESDYISNVFKIMQYFKSHKIDAVPACDFEDELYKMYEPSKH